MQESIGVSPPTTWGRSPAGTPRWRLLVSTGDEVVLNFGVVVRTELVRPSGDEELIL